MSPPARCPMCQRPLPPPLPTGERPGAPFCSERCRLLDLGNWLGESYRIPGAPDAAFFAPEGRGVPAGAGDSEGAPSSEDDE